MRSSVYEPLLATVALRPPLRKMSTREALRPGQRSTTFVPLTEVVSEGAGGGGGVCAGGGGAAAADEERRTAPLVGPSVTDVVEDPSSRSYDRSSGTVTVAPVGLTSTVPSVKLRRQAEPTWKRAPTGVPTSAVQLAVYGSCASGSLASNISAPWFDGWSTGRKVGRA